MYWFCHTTTGICHGCTHGPHPEPPSHLRPRTIPLVIPVHQPQASCILHRTWTGDSFHIRYYTYFNAILPNHPTLSLSHRAYISPSTSTDLKISNWGYMEETRRISKGILSFSPYKKSPDSCITKKSTFKTFYLIFICSVNLIKHL